MTFEEYLVQKKIDGKQFYEAEPQLYKSWNIEFDQLHINSFTAQKLYLINPLRRKYTLTQAIVKGKEEASLVESIQAENDIKPEGAIPQVSPNPKPGRPVFKPKPKID